MSEFVNACFIYGFLGDDAENIRKKIPEDIAEENSEIQERHHIYIHHVGYANITIISAYEIYDSGKSCGSSETIPHEAIAITKTYDTHFDAFFDACQILVTIKPQWHLLAYAD